MITIIVLLLDRKVLINNKPKININNFGSSARRSNTNLNISTNNQ